MKIKTYKYEKVEVAETEIFIPQEPYYCFETGVRRSIRIIPVFTSWQIEQGKESEVLYKLDVTCVYRSYQVKVEKFSLPIHAIEGLVNQKESSLLKSVVELLLNKWGDSRTKEQFDADLQAVIDEINKIED